MDLPNFFVVGAAKGGTTSLYHYLNQHPDIWMSPVKDPNYFCADAPWRRWFPSVASTLEEYLGLFAGSDGATAVGESSVSYLPHPPAAGRIHDLVPGARIIAVLREPAERAYADYVWLRVYGMKKPRTFREAVEAELDCSSEWLHFVRSGMYAQHVGRYLELFGRSQVRVYLFDDLAEDAGALVQDLYTFLEVEPSVRPNLAKHNVAQQPARFPFVETAMRSRGANAALRILPDSSRQKLKAAVWRHTREVPTFDDDVRRHLKDLYRDDVLRLQDLIDRDLSVWLD